MKKIGILQFNPHTFWKKGGGELHAAKYAELLPSLGYETEYFNFRNAPKYDLIHFFGSNFQLAEIGKYARLEGIRVVGTPILFPSRNVMKYKAFLSADRFLPFPTTLRLRKMVLDDSDLLIANTNEEKQYLINAYQCETNKIKVLGTGVDAQYLDFTASPDMLPAAVKSVGKYVLMVGRVTPLKQQLEVLQALEGESTPVVLCGPADPYEQEYCAAIEKIIARHPERLVWIKGLEAGSEQLKALYSHALCHVLYSRTDVAPLVNMEAAALGTLVLTRSHITVSEIMGSTAEYADDATGLRNQVRKIASFSPEDRSTRIKTLREHVSRKYTWEHIVAETAKLYENLI